MAALDRRDAVDLVGLTRALVDTESTTGREAGAGAWPVRYLRDCGFAVTEHPVDERGASDD